MAMQLSELIQDLTGARLVVGAGDVQVRSVRDDSRRVDPGDLFVAVRGLTVDGHAFARAAVERGASAVVVEQEQMGLNVPQVVVSSGAQALAWLAARAVGRPTDRMRLVGITGTNGKTTTTYLVESILAAAAARPGVIGTVSFRWAGRELPATFTTPTPVELHALLGQMADAGVTDLVMETSSAALAMERLEGVTFQVAAFSNLTQDHLDVHGTMEAYFEAKARLFGERLAPDGVAVAMIDDAGEGRAILARAPSTARKIAVSVRSESKAEVRVLRAQSTIAGISATFATPRGELEHPVGGAARRVQPREHRIGDRHWRGIGIASRRDCRRHCRRGRRARACAAGGQSARRGCVRRLCAYSGCPRSRDRGVAAAHPRAAHRRVWLRRGSRPHQAAQDGARGGARRRRRGGHVGQPAHRGAGVDHRHDLAGRRRVRRTAGAPGRASQRQGCVCGRAGSAACHRLAILAAKPGDVVLIAGKGHEDYQILGKTKIHFDDREEALAAAQALP